MTEPAASAPPLPLVDLAAQHRSLEPALDQAIARVIATSSFILGPEVEGFEREFAAFLGVRHVLGVSNGTDALALALRAHGIGAGDEVIVPSWSFIASATAVRMAGAIPVFADVDPTTCHLDPRSTEARVGPRTRAVLPVHLYGQSVDLAPFQELCRRHGLVLIEDACQAHGARLGERMAGAAGHASAFSFYPSKNLGCLGDGGAVATDDDAVAGRIRRLRSHGEVRKYDHEILGFNHRLDALQAAVLRVKLPHLARWNARRRAIAAVYLEALGGLPLALPHPAPGRDHVFHVFVVRTPRRDALAAHLRRLGIATVIHYPTAIHQQPAYADAGVKPGELPCSEALGPEVLSLPLYPEMDDGQVERVVEGVRSFFRG